MEMELNIVVCSQLLMISIYSILGTHNAPSHMYSTLIQSLLVSEKGKIKRDIRTPGLALTLSAIPLSATQCYTLGL